MEKFDRAIMFNGKGMEDPPSLQERIYAMDMYSKVHDYDTRVTDAFFEL